MNHDDHANPKYPETLTQSGKSETPAQAVESLAKVAQDNIGPIKILLGHLARRLEAPD